MERKTKEIDEEKCGKRKEMDKQLNNRFNRFHFKHFIFMNKNSNFTLLLDWFLYG